MLRSITLAAAVAALSLAFVATDVSDASARPGGGRGGFSGGARMGGSSFRAAGPSFRAGNFARAPGVRFANPGFRRHGNFRRFGFVGLPLVGAYGAYSYYNNDCVVPQTVLTPYGYQTRLVNVCDDYLY
jgi:hypothetical protein